MKKTPLLLIILFSGFLGFAQKSIWPSNTVYDIFPGDYADPSVLRDGKDYYMTHSSTSLLVWHSTDLLHWKPISRPLPAYSLDVWAPEIIKHKNRFYIYYPQRGKIYVLIANNPAGPWGEPIALNIPGIDPGIITTPENKRFLYINGGSVVELSEDGLSVMGSLKKVYDGWQYPKDWVLECFCLESPKLIFHKGYYYMTSAQGGTSGPSTSHMAVVARSKSPEGPWENSPYNPIVKTWSNKEEYASKGHGTIFSDADGQWYIVYHAYQKGQISMGRHTLIEPIKWTEDGWFTSSIDKAKKITYRTINNTEITSDDFTGDKLKLQWNLSGIDNAADYKLQKGSITINGSSSKIRKIQLIASDKSYEASIKINIKGSADAGLAVWYNNSKFVGLSIADGKLSAIRDDQRTDKGINATDIHYLKVKMDNYDLSLLYSSDGLTWQTYPSAFEMSGYQTNILHDFSSLRPSVYIKGQGTVTIENFTYEKLP